MKTERGFECVKASWRQTKDGFYVTFCIHPQDISEALAMAPLGTRFMVGFAEIGEDEKPRDGDGGGKTKSEPAVQARETALHADPKAERSKRKFSELSPTEQAGIRCGERDFQEFLADRYKDLWFSWPDLPVADQAAKSVRALCSVNSRSELAANRGAAIRWRELREQFEAWQLEQRYTDVRR